MMPELGNYLLCLAAGAGAAAKYLSAMGRSAPGNDG